jgi:RTX calcium-binding nonapeptide repeat (4 copies)
MNQGRFVRRLSLASLVVLSLAASTTIALAIPSPAPAAITLGPNPLPQRTGTTTEGGARIFANDVVPGATLTAPLDGVVVRWRVRRGSGGGLMVADMLTLRILRPTGVANEFTASGTSDAHAVPGGVSDPIDVYEFPTQLPIKTSDRLGLGTTVGQFTFLAVAGASYLTRTNALDDGQTATFAAGGFADQAVLMNADIEADCDNDGLGDETQDTNLSTCPAGTTPTGPAPTLPSGAPATCRGLPATILGTDGSDVRTGSQGRDVIAGLGGNDNLSGLGGNDVICGAKGNDTLRGGAGKDTVLGQKGSDNLLGNKGMDKLSGKKGNDRLKGAGGRDKMKGGGGSDTCIGGKANDSASKCEVEKSI